jgi:mannose-6-phosphate isomerase-like protein (cupin superfamily)
MKIRVKERVEFRADKMAKIALATTARTQLDLYCLAPGQEQKPHAHQDQDKIYFVLEGRGRVVLDGREETLEAGEAVVAPAGKTHGLVNTGTTPLLALVVVTPPPPPGA